MRTGPLLLTVAAAALLPGVPARAAQPADVIGGCSYRMIGNRLHDDGYAGTYRGELDIAAVVLRRDGSATPVTATITCLFRVNGVHQPESDLSATGTTVVAGARLFELTLREVDVGELCERVDVADDGEPPRTYCYGATTTMQFPPEALRELLAPVLDPVDAALETAEVTACAAAGTAAGDHGPASVGPDGDLFIDGDAEAYVDCPEYAP